MGNSEGVCYLRVHGLWFIYFLFRIPVVKNPPSNAGDMGLIPGQGTKTPHALGQLSPCAAIREASSPQVLSPHSTRKTHTLQLEKACAPQ